jgi:DHA2 family methylenomycin A resistance protein-like MFS transporter
MYKPAFNSRSASGWTLWTTSLGSSLILLNVTIINVAAPYIGASFISGVTGVQWLVNAYTLAFASMLLPAGVIADRYGSRLVFMGGLAIFGCASAVCIFAQSMLDLTMLRLFQGVGAALILPTSLSLLAHANVRNDQARAQALGHWSAIGGVVSAAGPAVGGLLLAGFGWKSIFLLNLPLCLLGLLLAWKFVAETNVQPRRFDVASQFLAIILFTSLTGALIEVGTRGWADPSVLLALAISFAACVAFAIAQAKSDEPVLPGTLMRDPVFTTSLWLGLMANLTFYGAIFTLSIYFEKVRHFTPAETGLAFLPFAAIMVGSLASAPVAARFGYRAPIVGGFAVTALGYLLLGLLLDTHTPYSIILWGLLLMSIGGGLAIPALTAALLGRVTGSYSGTASGVFNTGRQIGAALGVALFGALVARDSGALTASGVAQAFMLSLYTLLAAIALAAWLLPSSKR